MNEDALIEAGKAARAQGDLVLAVSLYKQALMVNPDSHSAVKGLGSALHAQSEFDAAAEVYRQAISRMETRHETAEDLGNLHLSLGAALTELNRLEEAQEQLAEAIQLGADELLLHDSRGHGHLALKQYDEALADYNAYIQLTSGDPIGYIGKARAFRGKQEYNFAAEALKTAHTLAPDNYRVEMALGNLAIDVADYRGALEHYEKASSLEPHIPAIRSNIGLAYLSLGEYAAAKQAFSDALEQSPNDLKSVVGLARAEEGLGNGRQAIALFKSAIVADPSNVSYYAALCSAQAASGKILDAALTALRGRKVRLRKQKR